MEDNHQIIENLFQQYCEEVKELLKESKPFAGLFGFGTGPKDDPCHARFIKKVNQETERMANEPVSADEASKTVRFLLSIQLGCEKEGLIYWTCMAAHGAALPLIPLLLPTDALEIFDTYSKDLPKRMRMPLQEKVMKALRNRSKGV